MLLKNLKLFFLISLIFLLIFYLNLTISAKCKSIKIFKSSLDFGISHLNGCYSHSSLVPEIKVLLSNSPFLYEVARKYRKNFSTSGYILDTPPTKEELVFVEKKENLNKDIEIPFIKGLLNNDDGKNYLVKGVKFQSENWGRSHGDHQNSKFHPSKQINKKNIKNLKLLWKYEGLKNKKSKKNNNENSLDGTVATTNIESNPIFVDNKIISISADWRVVANDQLVESLFGICSL